ncbi:MAG TPA: chorismate mutase [Polyangiaceae bacterium]|nr:chorismate mutase [Polyangiaceae bacterium]
MTTELDLERLRSEIDDIDTKILDLVARRIAAVIEIGKYKRVRGLPVYDATRERQVLARLMQNAPAGLDPQVVRRVFERIIDESRGIEHHEATHHEPSKT